jgi:hypothetical protein
MTHPHRRLRVDEQTDVRSDRPSQDVEQGFNTQTPATEGHSKLAPVQPPITRIEVTVEDMPAVAAQAWAALRSVTDTNGRSQFIRVGNLACVRNEDGYEQLLAAALTYRLARTAVFYKTLKDGEQKIVKPPRWLVADMLATPVPDLEEAE